MALYEKRKAQFTSPQMYRLDGMGFGSAKAAQAALEKLKAGTDLEWLRANAEGQLKPEEQAFQLAGRARQREHHAAVAGRRR